MSVNWGIDWGTAFSPVSPLDMVLRGTVVYLALFVLLRVFVRREAGSTGMTDLLFLVLLADAAQNAMAGEYTSITDGLILVGTIVGWSVAIDAAAYRWPAVARVVRPRSKMLIRDGRLVPGSLRRELLTRGELMGELRLHGVERVSDVARAWMEHNGQVSVIRKEWDEQEDAGEVPDRPGPP